MDSIKNEIIEILNSWLELILKEKKQPDDGIQAYNFGLFESEKGYEIYLMGADQYDEEDDDWACEEGYEPDNKYCALPEGLNKFEWDKALEIIIKSLKELSMSQQFQNSFLNKAEAITTGFDDGDLARIK